MAAKYQARGSHIKCERCSSDAPWLKREDLEQHYSNCHFTCSTCKPRQFFGSQASLDDHYRGKPSHPNCPRCNKGFFDKAAVEVHFAATHRKEKCMCGMEVYEDDMANHLLHSPNHTVCPTCTVGFKTEQEFTAHCKDEHPERHCERCTRHFFSDAEMEEHYRLSVRHPDCHECGRGFVDEQTCFQHMVAQHGYSNQASSFPGTLTFDTKKATLPKPGSEEAVNFKWDRIHNHNVPPPTFNAPANGRMETTSYILQKDSKFMCTMADTDSERGTSEVTPKAHRDSSASIAASMSASPASPIRRQPSTWSFHQGYGPIGSSSIKTASSPHSSQSSTGGWSSSPVLGSDHATGRHTSPPPEIRVP
ncbi:hypothetical protein C8F01DRAFT_1323835 [Mycena amicta]|nr:hypothetical protein C8F01DRAFT_1323835 [Mycena amicta]